MLVITGLITGIVANIIMIDGVALQVGDTLRVEEIPGENGESQSASSAYPRAEQRYCLA